MIKLYNSLTKKREDFTPLQQGKVSMYSCGPTVYNNLHIGNLAAFIYADTLRRMFTLSDFDVTHVMNITDVDDKTIRDSKLAYPDIAPIQALKKLTDTYTQVFFDDMKATGNDLESIKIVSAVETIPEMITLTQQLLDKDIAYITDDGVYFSITKYYQAGHTYGQLQKIATQQSKSRILNDEYDKENASDFALWKKSINNEPSWDATFSEDAMQKNLPGRPGWHIECSAMSLKTLGLPFDIHTGGIDLKFPHHENEIAQSVGAGAEKLAHYFIHNNHILVDGKKMAKSAHNFYTLRDLEKKGYDPITFRLLVLESHYHSESNFGWDILQATKNRLANWQAIADLRWQLPEDETDISGLIINALQDNLNTPQAIKEVAVYFDRIQKSQTSPHSNVLDTIQAGLGINLRQPDIDDATKLLLEKRKQARDNKNWELSDRLRNELHDVGVEVKDVSDGQIWSRAN